MNLYFPWPSLEIERKFLVISEEWRDNICSESHIFQSYISKFIGLTVRVRKINGRSLINYKTARIGISRSELDIAVSDGYADILFSLCRFPAIEKKRYHVSDHGKVWHVDVYLGRHCGLVVAEIELDHPAQSFALPNWIGDEITHDRRFSNSNLYEMETQVLFSDQK